MQRVISNYFPVGTPPLENIMTNSQLVFLSTHSAMGFVKPPVRTIVEVGGLHISPPKPLPQDLEAFISGAEHGVIYFSLGSVIPESTMNQYVADSILNTFRRLKQRILWKIDGKRKNVPKNVMMSKWFPQQGILSK